MRINTNEIVWAERVKTRRISASCERVSQLLDDCEHLVSIYGCAFADADFDDAPGLW